MSYAVMISHSTRDSALAGVVCRSLEAAGLPCWIAPRDIAPGAEWTAAILEGIRSSRLLVLLFSEGANASAHVAREVLYAGDNKIPVLPFRVQETVPTGGIAYYLLGVQWLDAWTPPLEGHIATLIARVRRMLGVTGTDGAAADIRFECGACGQAMVTEAWGAGLNVDCPWCGAAVTIPPPVPPPPPELAALVPEPPPPLPPLPAAVTDAIAGRLGLILGPIARHLVRDVSARVSTLEELCAGLAESIPDARERGAFLRACRPELAAAENPGAAPRPPASSSVPVSAPAPARGPAVRWEAAVLDPLKKSLAAYLGPVANFLVDQTARQAATTEELHERLAAKIPSARDREAWSKSLASPPR